ncbi:MAG: chemotaxis protein CheD, partial [Angelakisella sp.]
MSSAITVGIADLNVAKSPEVLVTYALGSCVGICLYDANARVGGLVHIMLPDSTQIFGGSQQLNKFADTGIAELIKRMEALGARRTFMKAKIAGGAQMFAAISNSAIANIGNRNVVAVKEVLLSLH